MNSLMWFRKDLRVIDNPALSAACHQAERGGGLVRAIYIASPTQWAAHHSAATQLDFIARQLFSLSGALAEMGIALDVIRCDTFGDIPQTLAAYRQKWHLETLYASVEPEWNEVLRDKAVALAGIPLQLFDHHSLLPPGAVRNGAGNRFQVFTPYSKRWLTLAAAQPLVPIAKPLGFLPALPSPNQSTFTAWLVACGFPSDVDPKIQNRWPIGESAALESLDAFLLDQLEYYGEERDFPALDGTSQLSHYVAIGVISPRQILAAVLGRFPDVLFNGESKARRWLNQWIWRDFYHHLLVDMPGLSKGDNYHAGADAIVWRNNAAEFEAWCEGKTGYPIVDAAMRQLVQTGWMHNRLRMVVASFLTKHLLIDWRWGEQFFMRHLIDGDLASNNGGWQWSAGTGCDAQPYFRMFNPNLQSERFDKQAVFIKRYVPELEAVAPKVIHTLGNQTADDFGAVMGYPMPIVNHRFARTRALAVLSVLKSPAALPGH